MKIIDISVSINDRLPLWPNSSGLRVTRISKIGKGKHVNESHIEMNAHIGTHMDAPLHFVHNGKSIDKLSLEILIGPVLVVDLKNSKQIGPKELEGLNIPKGVKRILFKTSNSKLWKSKNFNKSYVGVTAEGAKWLVKRGVKLIGIDYLSIAKLDEAVEVHQMLLGKGVCIVESLDLSNVKAGQYKLVCLPAKLIGAEAAPARAVLLK